MRAPPVRRPSSAGPAVLAAGCARAALLVSAVLLAGPSAVAASPDVAIAACRAAHAGSPAAHVACLEDALRAAASAPSTTPAASARVAVAPAVPGPVATPSQVPAATPAPPPAATTADRELGAEQLEQAARRGERPEPVRVEIADFAYDGRGFGTFRLANGQAWRETMAAPPAQRLKRGQAYVGRIEPGRFGGYRLYLDGVRWMYTVERVR